MEDQTAQISDQVSEQWRALLSLMTSQGASREDIANLTTATAGAMLALTGEALWPRAQTPPAGEKEMHQRFTTAIEVLKGEAK